MDTGEWNNERYVSMGRRERSGHVALHEMEKNEVRDGSIKSLENYVDNTAACNAFASREEGVSLWSYLWLMAENLKWMLYCLAWQQSDCRSLDANQRLHQAGFFYDGQTKEISWPGEKLCRCFCQGSTLETARLSCSTVVITYCNPVSNYPIVFCYSTQDDRKKAGQLELVLNHLHVQEKDCLIQILVSTLKAVLFQFFWHPLLLYEWTAS